MHGLGNFDTPNVQFWEAFDFKVSGAGGRITSENVFEGSAWVRRQEE